jgi:hypothetical protein
MAHNDARRTSPPQFAAVLTTLIHPAALSKRNSGAESTLNAPGVILLAPNLPDWLEIMETYAPLERHTSV